MSKRKLDLLQFAARNVAQAGTRAAEIMCILLGWPPVKGNPKQSKPKAQVLENRPGAPAEWRGY